MKDNMTIPLKIYHKIPYDPTAMLINIYKNKLKADTWTDICIQMFTAAYSS